MQKEVLKYLVREVKTLKIWESHERHNDALDAVIILRRQNVGKDFFVDVVEKKTTQNIFSK